MSAATRRVLAKLKATELLLGVISGSNHLDGVQYVQQALLLLDSTIGDVESNIIPIEEDLTDQVDGNTTDFTTQNSYSDITVHLNGLKQLSGAGGDYIIVNSNTIRFASALPVGSVLQVVYYRS